MSLRSKMEAPKFNESVVEVYEVALTVLINLNSSLTHSLESEDFNWTADLDSLTSCYRSCQTAKCLWSMFLRCKSCQWQT